jgi:hypothetical protein
MKYKIVIARYNESLEWLKKKAFHYPYIVYNKGPNSDFYKSDLFVKEIKLKNVGRETHTYFTHIVNNYDLLDDLTIFVPGSLETKNRYKRSIRLMQEAKGDTFSCYRGNVFEQQKTFKIDNYLSTNKRNSVLNPDSTMKKSKIRPFGKWYNKTFKHGHKKSTCFTGNSMFALTKETILRKPKTYYESLLQQVNDHHNHEEVHYFERAWDTVFYPYSKVKYLYNK